MAGIYLHIPFCRRACHYCDFHFTTNLRNADSLVDAMLREIETRRSYLNSETVKTIYFGGGTPSLLPTTDIERLLNSIHRTQSVAADIEFTLEANPEDLSKSKLQELKDLGVNRLSLGTQSFIDTELQWMNRMHTAKQAESAIRNAQEIGFDNISIDLIFGLPQQTLQDWQQNLNKAIALDIQHISSYSLTVEPKTVLRKRISSEEQLPPDEDIASQCFEMNTEFLPANGFEHYEISNFAKDGFVSKHNSSYWLGENYLGVGPSAHSFNGKQRQWNVRSNGAYVQKINTNEPFYEVEKLTSNDRINELIMTGLRTKWGLRKQDLHAIDATAWDQILEELKTVDSSNYVLNDYHLWLTESGKLRSDMICAQLFIT